MEASLLEWLTSIGWRAFTVSAWAFVLVNGAAFAAAFITRDRTLVNRWTGRLLGVNLVIAGTGLGVPLLTSMARLAVSAVVPAMSVMHPSVSKEPDIPRIPSASRSTVQP